MIGGRVRTGRGAAGTEAGAPRGVGSPSAARPYLQRQAPITQVRPAAQALPQAPQLALLVVRLVHAVPQRVRPVAQVQAPATQNDPPVQGLPQRPQLLLLV